MVTSQTEKYKMNAAKNKRLDPAGFAGSGPVGLGALNPLKRLGVAPAGADAVPVGAVFEVENSPPVVALVVPAGCVPNKLPPVVVVAPEIFGVAIFPKRLVVAVGAVAGVLVVLDVAVVFPNSPPAGVAEGVLDVVLFVPKPLNKLPVVPTE
jgi:hypothetical protein